MLVSVGIDFWVVFCRDEGNDRADSSLCVNFVCSVLLCFFLLGLCSVFFLGLPLSLGSVNCSVFIGTNLPLPQPHVSPPDKHG